MKKTIDNILENLVQHDTIFFFDMDGTLVNTDLSNYFSYKQSLMDIMGTDFNLEFNPEIRLTRSKLRELIPSINVEQMHMIIELKEKYYDNFLPYTSIIEPVYNVLNKYNFTNNSVLVTNCREQRAISTLKYHGLLDKFTWIFFRKINDFGDRVNKFDNALSFLELDPSKVIAFENEQSEREDAAKAGISIINPINF